MNSAAPFSRRPQEASPFLPRHRASLAWRRSALGAGLFLFAGWVSQELAPQLSAFPPGPHYVIYGIVRDQVGATLSVQGADIILLRDGKEIGRAAIATELHGDLNYELNIAIDQNRAGSRTYSPRSVPAQGVFSLVVEMNGEKFYPIEVAGTLRAGNGGERVQLDLNLGRDSDLDGLPDAWEEWQLYQAGKLPGPTGWDLSLINRDGDFDGDGIRNYDEYLAGTFAGDATERFELILREKTATQVEFEFFAITGKIYSLEESTDLQNWTVVPFSTAPAAATARSYRATAVGVLPAYVPASSGASRFYRMAVR